jgi:hypothetical protein
MTAFASLAKVDASLPLHWFGQWQVRHVAVCYTDRGNANTGHETLHLWADKGPAISPVYMRKERLRVT